MRGETNVPRARAAASCVQGDYFSIEPQERWCATWYAVYTGVSIVQWINTRKRLFCVIMIGGRQKKKNRIGFTKKIIPRSRFAIKYNHPVFVRKLLPSFPSRNRLLYLKTTNAATSRSRYSIYHRIGCWTIFKDEPSNIYYIGPVQQLCLVCVRECVKTNESRGIRARYNAHRVRIYKSQKSYNPRTCHGQWSVTNFIPITISFAVLNKPPGDN